eukprot:g21193.t1
MNHFFTVFDWARGIPGPRPLRYPVRGKVAANYRHFASGIFPYGFTVTSGDFAPGSNCHLAVDAEEDKDHLVRIFTSLHLQRLRKSTPPNHTVPSVMSTRTGNRTGLAG